MSLFFLSSAITFDVRLNSQLIQRDQAKTIKVPERLSEMTMCIWVKLTSEQFTDFTLVEYKSSVQNNGFGLRLTFPGKLKKKPSTDTFLRSSE